MDELRDFVLQNRSKNTKKKTNCAMKKMTVFLASKNENRKIEEIPPSDLNLYIGQFLMEAKKEDGTDYEPESLTGLQRSIERHLKDHSYSESILRSPAFQASRDVLTTRKEILKSQGKGNLPNKAEAVTVTEEEVLWQKGILGKWSPLVLIRTVWFLITKMCGLRGCTEHHAMRNGDITLKVSVDGEEYIELNERLTKTRRGQACNARPFNPKAFPADNPDRCLVELYKEYQRRKPNRMKSPDSSFYLGINYLRQWDDEIWYKCSSMGINKLSSFMKSMAEEGVVPGKKTNHAVRSTTCTRLMHAGVDESVACQLTGHKNTNSLKRYATASFDQQREMSRILSGSKKQCQMPHGGTPAMTPSTSADAEPRQSSRQPLAEISVPAPDKNQNNTMVSNTNNPLSGLFAGATINGGTFNITINVPQAQPSKASGWNLPGPSENIPFEIEIDDSILTGIPIPL